MKLDDYGFAWKRLRFGAKASSPYIVETWLETISFENCSLDDIWHLNVRLYKHNKSVLYLTQNVRRGGETCWIIDVVGSLTKKDWEDIYTAYPILKGIKITHSQHKWEN